MLNFFKKVSQLLALGSMGIHEKRYWDREKKEQERKEPQATNREDISRENISILVDRSEKTMRRHSVYEQKNPGLDGKSEAKRE